MENRTERIELRLNETEKKELLEKSKVAGLTVSEYIRKVCLELKVEDVIKSLDVERHKYKLKRDTYRELSKIGVNVNQLIKLLHKRGGITYAEDIKKARDILSEIKSKIDKL